MKTTMFAVVVGLALAACTATSPEMQLVHDAADAMGGLDRITAINTLVLEGEGENFNLGQNVRPDADLPVYKVTEYRRAIDFAGSRWRQEQVRTPTFPTGNPAPQRQVAAIDGDVAFNVAPNGSAARAAAQVAKDRRAELFHHPVGSVRAAAAEGAKVGNLRQDGAHDAVDVTTAGGDTFTLFVDRTSKLPAKVVSRSYNVNLGDVDLATEFGDYGDADGLTLPGRLTSKIDRYTVADIRVAKSAVNGDTGDLAAPADVRSAPEPAVAANVATEEIGRGIWYLAGQSHHSILVEFADHLALIEAPQHETRTLAVIRAAREIKPDKPLRYVVNTHHHFDHSGGVRAAVSEGLTVVTHELNKGFFEEMVARNHTVVADALAKNPKPLAIETVADRHVLSDGKRTIEIYPIAGSPHAETLLMVYFPAERLLVQADVYSPPAPNAPTPPAFPFAPNLLENIEKRKLRVDRMVPIHGRVVPFKELLAAAKPTE